MELRNILTAKRPSAERVAELTADLEAVIDAMDRGQDVSGLIEAFSGKTGRPYRRDDFEEYWASRSLEELVWEAAHPRPVRVPDITRDELIEIIRRTMPSEPGYSREEETFYRELFDANVPMPGASNLVYYPPDSSRRSSAVWAPTPEQIVELALAYKPILL